MMDFWLKKYSENVFAITFVRNDDTIVLEDCSIEVSC